MKERFDPDLLDPENPFEIDDGNRPHLYKHLPDVDNRYVAVGVGDILDAYIYGEPLFDPAREDGPADWIMIGEAPGIVIAVPLAPPDSGDGRECRPIGLYAASPDEKRRHREGTS